MVWRDEHGIQHHGSPPEGRIQLGGRWYELAPSLAAVRPMERRPHPKVRPLVVAA